MPSSNSGSKPLFGEESLGAINFTPPEIKSDISQRHYETLRDGKSSFKLSELVKTQSRLREAHSREEQREIEAQVLGRIGVIQEEAYKKGFELGHREGEAKIWKEKAAEIEPFFNEVPRLLEGLANLRSELIAQNEKSLMEIVFAIARKVITTEVEFNPEFVIAMLREATTKAQAKDDLEVLVSKGQFEFFETFAQSTNREHDFLKTIKVSSSEDLTVGSFILKTAHGEFDGRIEEKIAKLWEEVSSLFPKRKTEIKSVS